MAAVGVTGATIGAAAGGAAAVLTAGTGRSSGAERVSRSGVLGAPAIEGTSPVVATGVFLTDAGTATSTAPPPDALTAVSRLAAIGVGSNAAEGVDAVGVA